MDRLLELTPDQIARETERGRRAIQDDRAVRRLLVRTVVVAATIWAVGLLLVGLAGHVRDWNVGAMLFWSGLALGNAGPMYTGLWYWGRVHG